MNIKINKQNRSNKSIQLYLLKRLVILSCIVEMSTTSLLAGQNNTNINQYSNMACQQGDLQKLVSDKDLFGLRQKLKNDSSAIDAVDACGDTALAIAVRNQDYEGISTLLNNNANTNIQTRGTYAIIDALEREDMWLAAYLATCGADTWAYNEEGNNAIKEASRLTLKTIVNKTKWFFLETIIIYAKELMWQRVNDIIRQRL